MAATSRELVRLRPHLQLIESDDRMLLCGDEVTAISHPPPDLRQLLRQLAQSDGVELPELEALDAASLQTLAHLHERRLLQASGAPFSPARSGTSAYFDTTLALPDAEMQLQRCAVAIVGCGGIGGELVRHLLASGLGRVALVDDDVVSEANLNRQYLFRRSDIGRPKVEAARDALEAVHQRVELSGFERRVDSAADLGCLDALELDAIVCCADMPVGLIQDHVSEYAERRQLWFACASVGVDRGSWGPLIAPGSVPYHRRPRSRLLAQHTDEVRPVSASFGPTNSAISALLARDLLHALLGDRPPSLDRRCVLEFGNPRVNAAPGVAP